MKVLGIAGSPRKNGNSEFLVKEALRSAQEEGAEVELILLREKDIKPCDACWSCYTTHPGKCHIKDDMQEIYEKLKAADGIIIGSPTHFGTISSICLAFVERSFCLVSQPLKDGVYSQAGKTSALIGRVGGVIVTGRRRGVQGAADTLIFFFMHHRMAMPHAGVHGFCQGIERPAIQKEDKVAVEMAAELGKEVVKYIKKLTS